MVRSTLIHISGDHFRSMPLAIGLFAAVIAVVALCAKHFRRVAKKPESSSNDSGSIHSIATSHEDHYQEKFPPRSPLRSPKQLITTISNKALNSFAINHKRSGATGGDGGGVAVEEGFGEGGLWQKEILMGEKCQPPEFSGVIYYDCDGNRVSAFPPRSPRSPRISPSPNFSFPVLQSQV